MKYFCTYFDSNYLPQAIALYHSLCKQDFKFKLFVVCLNDKSYDVLNTLKIENIHPLKLAEVEAFDPEFAECRGNRSIVEFYFTLSPVMPLYIFDKFGEVDILGYLDADLLFYSSPQPLYEELGDNSILIIEHRFPEAIKYREKFGRFNVQFQLYRRDNNGIKCLKWWREKCIEWCYDVVEKNRFADQKYLNLWPELFDKVVVSKLKGAGLSPWNWYNYEISTEKNRKVMIDDENLIFYHFQGFKVLNNFLLQHNLGHYGKVMPKRLLTFFYIGYLKAVSSASNWLSEQFEGESFPVIVRNSRTGLSNLRTIASSIYHKSVMVIYEKF
ncbi:MAG: glycosyl transferase [Lentisphaerae bacterium]|nr:glycosyl transferase [Lentisphaerota bacterium]MCP4100705.1 glycosyl transferase [Lentisphaerota bacterium]